MEEVVTGITITLWVNPDGQPSLAIDSSGSKTSYSTSAPSLHLSVIPPPLPSPIQANQPFVEDFVCWQRTLANILEADERGPEADYRGPEAD